MHKIYNCTVSNFTLKRMRSVILVPSGFIWLGVIWYGKIDLLSGLPCLAQKADEKYSINNHKCINKLTITVSPKPW